MGPEGVPLVDRQTVEASLEVRRDDRLVARNVEAGRLKFTTELGPAVREAKALLNTLAGTVTPAQVDLSIDALADRWESDEARDGIAAFFEKRKAPWV